MKTRRFIMMVILLLCLSSFALADTLTLSFLGDSSIGDAIQFRNREQSYHGVVRSKGMDWPFSTVSDILKADDLTIANLEGSMTTRTRHKDVRWPLVIDPSHVGVLLSGSVEVVNTANNHAFDFFLEGYQDTLNNLDQAGIAHFGTLSPPSKTGVNRQVILEKKGVKIGFIGFTYPQKSDLKVLETAVLELREQGCALIILSLHWGRETHLTPNNTQFNFARQAMKTGIDLIYGHHPHVVQPIGTYEGKPVLFSTGNFTFGSMSKVDPSTGVFQVEYNLSAGAPKLSAIRVIPYLTSGSGDFRPQAVTDEKEKLSIFKKLSFKNPPRGFEALPDSFLTTGEARFQAE